MYICILYLKNPKLTRKIKGESPSLEKRRKGLFLRCKCRCRRLVKRVSVRYNVLLLYIDSRHDVAWKGLLE